MEPTLAQITAFTVAGISTRTTNREESVPETAKLPSLWGRFFAEGIASQIANAAEAKVYGVYSAYESDVNGAYTVTAGVQITEPENLIADFARVEVAAGDYLVFEGKGTMPQVVIETWGKVWNYFSQEQRFQRSYVTDFELSEGAEQVAIYISVVEA